MLHLFYITKDCLLSRSLHFLISLAIYRFIVITTAVVLDALALAVWVMFGWQRITTEIMDMTTA